MIRLPTNHSSLLVRCYPNAATLAPDSKISDGAFDLYCFHCSSRLDLHRPPAFETARRPRLCSPPDADISQECRSIQVFRTIRGRPVPLLHCGQEQTRWVLGTSGIERPSTSASRILSIVKCTRVIPASIETSAPHSSQRLSTSSGVRECGSCCAFWLYADDRNANDRHFCGTCLLLRSLRVRARHSGLKGIQE